MNDAAEVNFDGLVGPTHNYAGLSSDNRASRSSAFETSNPRAAAHEGIAKMRTLTALGVAQAVLPPHERPHVLTLRRLGFSGTDAQVLAGAARDAPELLAACSSASAMWAANAATVAPSADAADGRVHITPANLTAYVHRAIEAATTHRVLERIFSDGSRFAVHAPLLSTPSLSDEGAANHVRLGAPDGLGVHLFVHGHNGTRSEPTRSRPRQALEASRAVARLHLLDPSRVVEARQAPMAVDAGAFHNDVVAVGHRDVLLCHEHALEAQPHELARLSAAFGRHLDRALRMLVVPDREVTLDDAVRSYLFNGQLVSDPAGKTVLVVPEECREVASVGDWLERQEADPASPIDRVAVVGVRQSMRNGGGPACLRLCVPLTADERAALAPGVIADDALLESLGAWVDRHYRDRLVPADLADPQLLEESRAALDTLTGILGLGVVYEFQGPAR